MLMSMKVPALVVMLALVAPAVAVCAGPSSTSATASQTHECCPKDVVPAPAMDAACCAMSADAAQRVPTAPVRTVTAPSSSLALPAWVQQPSDLDRLARAAFVRTAADHVPRHLRPAVLII
jgi:hypothetical protein